MLAPGAPSVFYVAWHLVVASGTQGAPPETSPSCLMVAPSCLVVLVAARIVITALCLHARRPPACPRAIASSQCPRNVPRAGGGRDCNQLGTRKQARRGLGAVTLVARG